MSKLIYYCKNNADNTCPKKDTCERYIECKDKENSSTLYKMSCTKDNKYQLYIENKKEEVNTNEQS